MEAEKTGGGNASPPNDYVIDIHENPLRFYGFSYDNVTQYEAVYTDEEIKRRIKNFKKEKRRKVRRLFLSILAGMIGIIFLILIYYYYATRNPHQVPRRDWWYIWLRRRLSRGAGSVEEMGEWRGDMVYVNRDPENTAQEGTQREKESGLQGDKGDGGGKSDYWGSPSLKEGNYTLACKNTQQGKTLVADDRGYVCKRELVMGLDRGKKGRGCCPVLRPPVMDTQAQFSCATCGGADTPYCCTLYEHCVSCCLSPDKTGIVKELLSSNEIPPQGKRLLDNKQDRFEVCSALCRTSSKNLGFRQYLHPAKHCYGPTLPPSKE